MSANPDPESRGAIVRVMSTPIDIAGPRPEIPLPARHRRRLTPPIPRSGGLVTLYMRTGTAHAAEFATDIVAIRARTEWMAENLPEVARDCLAHLRRYLLQLSCSSSAAVATMLRASTDKLGRCLTLCDFRP